MTLRLYEEIFITEAASRQFGLTCDSLLTAQIVKADDSLVTASAEENPELFKAIHGAGSNFGIVTHMTLRLHEENF